MKFSSYRLIGISILLFATTAYGGSKYLSTSNKTLIFVAGGPTSAEYRGFEEVTGKKPSGQDLWIYRVTPHAVQALGSPANTALFVHLTMKRRPDFDYDGNFASIRRGIRDVGQSLKELDRPILLTVGGELEFFSPLSSYKETFRLIHDEWKNMGVTNVSYIFHMACHMNASEEEIERYYPGDDYVDAMACSFYGPGNIPGARRLALYARRHGKAFGIAECGNFVVKDAHEYWNLYWKHVFDFVRLTDARFLVFLNCGNNPGTFPTMSSSVQTKWREEMNNPRYILSNEKMYRKIHYPW